MSRARAITLFIVISALVIANFLSIWQLRERTQERDDAQNLSQMLIIQGAQMQAEYQARILVEKKRGFCI